MPRFLWFGALILFSFSSVASTIRVGPEQAASYLSYTSQATSTNPQSTSVATDGDSFMAAWVTNGVIFVEPLDRDGAPRQRVTVPGTHNARSLFIVWAGSAYRLVWTEIGSRMYSADIDRDASVVVPPHPLNDQGGGSEAWDVAADPDRTLVTSFSFMMFDASGTFIGSMPMPINKLGAAALGPRGATVFWIEGSAAAETLYGRRLDSNGSAGPTFTVAQVSNVMQIAAAANGDATEVVVAAGQLSTYTIQRFTIDTSSKVTPLVPFSESPHRAGEFFSRVRVTPTRGGFLVYWATTTSIFTNESADTIEWHDLSDNYPNKAPIPELTLAAGAHIVGVNRVGSAFVLDATPALTPVKLYPIALFPIPQIGTAIASIGDQSLVVWTESRANADGVFSPIVVGSLLRGDGTRIGDLIPIGDGSGADVIAVGREYWVFWTLASPWGSAISFRRMQPDGSMNTPQFFWAATGTQIRVAKNDSVVQVVFVEGGAANILPGTLKGMRFDRDGQLLDPTPFIIFRPFGYAAAVSHPMIATNDDGFLVAFGFSYRTCQIGTGCYLAIASQALAARLDAGGNLIDQTPIAVTAERKYPDSVLVQDVASDGRDYFIAYSDPRGIYAKRMLREGVLADGIASQDGVVIESPPNVRALLLQRAPNGYVAFAVGSSDTTAIRLDIHGSRVDEPVSIHGIVFDSAVNADGIAVAYTRSADQPEAAGAMRVFTRELTIDAPRVRSVRRF